MHDILSELYLGNYRPFSRVYPPDSPYIQQSTRVSDLQDALRRTLPAEWRDKFLEYSRECEQLLALEGQEDFKLGFQLGVQLMLAALSPVSQ